MSVGREHGRRRGTGLVRGALGFGFAALSAGMLIAALPAGAKSGVGAKVRTVAFTDLKGTRYTTAAAGAAKATVFVFLSTECPISKRYGTRVEALARDYGPRGVRWFGVNANRQESAGTIAADARERGYSFPVVKDAGNRLADALGARMTPEAILLDAAGMVRYRGRIDDNADETRVQSSDLRLALDALLDGRPVPREQTSAFGCAIRRVTPVARAAKGGVTFTKDVAPILQRRCQGCHRPGDIGPFSLMSYDQASAWAVDLKRSTAARRMPPWKAAPGFGDFVNERRMTDAEIATIARWADAGAPEGDPRHLPKPVQFPRGWVLGTPDMVLQPEEAYHLDAGGKDVYRHFVLPTVFKEDRWVTGMEVAAQNRTVVHHVIAYIDPEGKSLALDAADPGPGYSNSGGGPGFWPALWLGGWAPGNTPRYAPLGSAVKIPAGSRIVLQVHYHKSGKPETDRTRVALYFAKSPVEKRIRVAPVLNLGMEVPAGAERQEITASIRLPADVHVHTVMPHMHLLGREIQVTATLPDGTVKPLVRIPDWNFNWQETYAFREPLALPGGTKIQVTAYYDNSEKNPNNPNHPPKTVRWGEETTDEMCIAFLSYTLDGENLLQTAKKAAAERDGIEVR